MRREEEEDVTTEYSEEGIPARLTMSDSDKAWYSKSDLAFVTSLILSCAKNMRI